jgi:hypothetical protein
MAYAPLLVLPVRDAGRPVLKGEYAACKKLLEFPALTRAKEKNSEVYIISEVFMNNVFFQMIIKWEYSVAA